MRRIYIALNDGAALGGLQTASAALGDALAANGYEVTYLTVTGSLPERTTHALFPAVQTILPRGVAFGGMRSHRIDLLGQAIYRARLGRLLRSRPGHVLCMDVFSAQLVSRVKVTRPHLKLFQFHNTFDAVKGGRELARIRRIAPIFDVNVALTPADASEFSRATAQEFISVPNVLRFEPAMEPDSSSKVVFSVCRLVASKRVDLSLRAWAALPKFITEAWRFKVVGDGPERSGLEALARELRISDRVDFLGRRDDVRSLLGTGSIFLINSDYEGLPMGIVEAMSQGLACIVSRSSPGSIHLAQEASAELVPVRDVSAITGALRLLMSSSERRLSMGRSGIAASRGYQAEIIVSKWERIIDARA